jgi:hypothetical protein
MGKGSAKRFARRVWRLAKWAVAGPITLIGLGGLPDALNSWIALFDRIFARVGAIMTDPRVEYLATKAVVVANFVNHPLVRLALVILGIGILIWGWRPFWNLRHRLRFAWRVLLGEETWISREEAKKIARASRWARMREPSPNLFEQIGRGISGGLTAYDRDMLLFGRYIEMTLESFEVNRPQAVREVEGKKEYAEGLLRAFMDSALDTEAIQKFGNLPT